METSPMPITRTLVLIALSSALLVGFSASRASNVYNGERVHADTGRTSDTEPLHFVCPNAYWDCPSELLAKETDPNVATDATALDWPEQPPQPLEDERRYYDYGPMILGD